jgi:MYXO-CTERM domain-containing protein
LNAFDFVVTVALGSTLATVLLNSDVSWSDGALALVMLALATRRRLVHRAPPR